MQSEHIFNRRCKLKWSLKKQKSYFSCVLSKNVFLFTLLRTRICGWHLRCRPCGKSRWEVPRALQCTQFFVLMTYGDLQSGGPGTGPLLWATEWLLWVFHSHFSRTLTRHFPVCTNGLVNPQASVCVNRHHSALCWILRGQYCDIFSLGRSFSPEEDSCKEGRWKSQAGAGMGFESGGGEVLLFSLPHNPSEFSHAFSAHPPLFLVLFL